MTDANAATGDQSTLADVRQDLAVPHLPPLFAAGAAFFVQFAQHQNELYNVEFHEVPSELRVHVNSASQKVLYQ